MVYVKFLYVYVYICIFVCVCTYARMRACVGVSISGILLCVLLESLAAEEKDTGGVTFVSAFQGLFAPYWNADARGYVILACVGGTAYSPTLG